MEETMILAGARVATGATQASRADLVLDRGRVFLSDAATGAGHIVDLSGFLILPGLINAHDHLELDLFPRLGRGPYPNATAWADDIYQPDQPTIKQHLAVPKPLRLFWGGIKNLLSGVTSVAHHNPYHPDVFDREFPVRVLKRFGWAHSIRFSPDWKDRYRQTPAGAPFIIHAAEGVDQNARGEIRRLDEASVLSGSTVVVHGVAVRSEELGVLKKRRASLIWCPSSNCFMLGRTISDEVLGSGVPVSLGTDSALTADGDLIDELRVANRFINAIQLYDMVTMTPARILGLESGAGTIRSGGIADLLIVPDSGQTPAEALLDLRPELVFLNGRINLVSTALAGRLRLRELDSYQSIELENRGRWLTPFNISQRIEEVQRALGGSLRLAGKAVTA